MIGESANSPTESISSVDQVLAPRRLVMVLKVGGSLLREKEGIHRIAGKLKMATLDGGTVLVVVSALSGVTDMLFELYEQKDRARFEELRGQIVDLHLSVDPAGEATRKAIDLFIESSEVMFKSEGIGASYSTADSLVSYGERISAHILCSLLQRDGVRAEVLDALRAVFLDSEGRPDMTRINREVENVISLSKDREILIIPGFYASDQDGRTKLLGRGGSDYTAVLLASALGSARLEYWKDVDGVLSADPDVIPSPLKYERISKSLLDVMTLSGSRIIQNKAIQAFDPEKMRICIRGTNGGSGTMIVNDCEGAFSVSHVESILAFRLNLERYEDKGCFLNGIQSFLASEGLMELCYWNSSSDILYVIESPVEPEMAGRISRIAKNLDLQEIPLDHSKGILVLVEDSPFKDSALSAADAVYMENAGGPVGSSKWGRLYPCSNGQLYELMKIIHLSVASLRGAS